MLKKSLPLILAGALLAAVPQPVLASQPPDVLGASAILMDAASGEVLYEKNSHEVYYPASITKLMTALLGAENLEMDEVITFSHDAVFSIEPGSSHIAIDEGEQITVEEAYYGIFLQSANEVSNGVAEMVDGSMEAFAKHMTQRAKELGALNTNFVNANGLHDPNHYTTAYDMAMIAREVWKHPELMEIMGTTYYEMQPTNKQPEIRYLYAQNQMIKQSSIYYYEYCLGGKNGYTTQSSNTLVTFAEKDGLRLICVTMKEDGANAYVDSIALFNYGFENFESKQIFEADSFIQTLPVIQQYGDETLTLGEATVYAEKDAFLTVLKGSEPAVKVIPAYPEYLIAPVEEGQVVGVVELQDENSTVIERVDLKLSTSINAIPEEELEENRRQERNDLIFGIIKVIVVILVVLVLLFFLMIYISERKRRKRWEANYRRRYKEKYGYEPKRIPNPKKRRK